MKDFLRISLLVLILAAVFLISALTAMRIAIHGREIVVPKLVGLTPAQAERVALQQGLLVQVENRFFSADVPQGHIMSQTPVPGTAVRRGWQVRLAESLGPQQVEIPNVVGQSSRAAEINVRRRGLELGTMAVAHLPGLPPDQVVAQSPPASAVGVANPKINLLMAAPDEPAAFVMPNLVGRPLAEASRLLESGGLKLGNVRVSGQEAAAAVATPAGNAVSPTALVVKQSPVPGSKIVAGTAVDLEVAK